MKVLLATLLLLSTLAPSLAETGDPYEIFSRDTTHSFIPFKPNDKLVVWAVADPLVDGVSCTYTAPQKGGFFGGWGEQTSDVSLACRQVGPIRFTGNASQGDDMSKVSRSLFFKAMHISRGCDAHTNMLVYMAFTDKFVDGSPKNSTSAVPIAPWGGDTTVQKCGDFIH